MRRDCRRLSCGHVRTGSFQCPSSEICEKIDRLDQPVFCAPWMVVAVANLKAKVLVEGSGRIQITNGDHRMINTAQSFNH